MSRLYKLIDAFKAASLRESGERGWLRQPLVTFRLTN